MNVVGFICGPTTVSIKTVTYEIGVLDRDSDDDNGIDKGESSKYEYIPSVQ